MIVVAFSFALGMVSATRMRGADGVVVAAAAPQCVPAPASAEAAHGTARAEHGGTETVAADGEAGTGDTGSGEGEGGEGNIFSRAQQHSRALGMERARVAAEGPINTFAEKLRDQIQEWLHFLPLPKDPRLDPMLFLNKEIDEAKEEQDSRLQDMISGKPPGGERAKTGATAAAKPAGEGQKPGTAVATAPAAKPEDAPKLPVAQLPPSAPPASQTLYTIELGRFRSAGNAQSFAGDVKDRGYTVHIDSQKDGFGQDWFLVRLGQYSDSMEAARQLQIFEQREGMNGVLAVVVPPIQTASAAAPAAAK
jgi:cell division septation protein DedD